MKKPTTIKKIGMFTDIHFGRRSNSKIHNQDCVDFIEWFCNNIKSDGSYTHLAFLGDWYESRSAINIETLDYSYKALKMINDLNLPIFFCVGNHDLHRRTTRDVHSVRMFNEFSNIVVVDSPTVIDNILFSPFLFEEEYEKLIKYNDLWAWAGHFEFKNFVLTGHTHLAQHGPDHTIFNGPKRIFSGHYHKRQFLDNVFYIGNAFPMDFGDASDNDRGMCTYEVEDDKVSFENWKDCPSYYKTTLSKVVDGKWNPIPKMKVKCIIDSDLGYQDAQDLREAFIQEYKLRDFILEEDRSFKQGLLEGDNNSVDILEQFDSINDLVIDQLNTIKEDKKAKIDGSLLVEIYKQLPNDNTDSEQND